MQNIDHDSRRAMLWKQLCLGFTVTTTHTSSLVATKLSPANFQCLASKNSWNMPKISRRSLKLATAANSASSLAKRILQGLQDRADTKTKDWFTNYVKGTTWFGCKMPAVREAVKASYQHVDSDTIMTTAIQLLQRQECDAKLAGMLLLSEKMALEELATRQTLSTLEQQVIAPGHLNDWSSADWFATKVLRKIVFSGNHNLVEQVLNFSNAKTHLWHRRCGVVAFVHQYPKHRDKLPSDFGSKLIQACETSLLASPEERFTQTGIAWVLRYSLLESLEREEAREMIVRHGSLWTTGAKKSLTEKLGKNDPVRKQILAL